MVDETAPQTPVIRNEGLRSANEGYKPAHQAPGESEVGQVLGIHHIKIPVSDLQSSRRWYERIFALEPYMEFPDEDGVVRGVAYRAKGDLALSLRESPSAAKGMAGFDPFAIMLRGRADVEHWAMRLDRLGVPHSSVIQAPIGYILMFDDPDGLQLRFYSLDERGSDPEGRIRVDRT
jgi:catechol 2,3-dioxygenase-like lactoylglutathione lyase family enzyme